MYWATTLIFTGGGLVCAAASGLPLPLPLVVLAIEGIPSRVTLKAASYHAPPAGTIANAAGRLTLGVGVVVEALVGALDDDGALGGRFAGARAIARAFSKAGNECAQQGAAQRRHEQGHADGVGDEAGNDEQKACGDGGIAVDQRGDAEPAAAHAVEHAAEHRRTLAADDQHAGGGGEHEQSQGRPQPEPAADLDQHADLEQRKPENEQCCGKM